MLIEPAILPRTSGYHSFLLRLWQEEVDSPWRASLQNVQTGAVVRFASLNALVTFLQEQAIGTPPLPPASADEAAMINNAVSIASPISSPISS